MPRAAKPRADGRVELVGLSKDADPRRVRGGGAGAASRRSSAPSRSGTGSTIAASTDFAAMSDIAKAQRAWFAERFVIARPEVVEAQVSTDGTRKWLLKTHDGHDFEMVFIPDADRGTLCVSSQVGCTLNCRFCHTGTMRLVRNLDAGEIVGQVMLARDALGEWPSQPEGRMLTNIVMMGMGEPLYNFDNVRDALKIVMDGDGLGAVAAADHALDQRRGADDGARRRGDRGQSRGVAARGDQGNARRDRAAQPQVRDRAAARGLRRLSGREQCAADHVRICDAEGQERQRRAMRASWSG